MHASYNMTFCPKGDTPFWKLLYNFFFLCLWKLMSRERDEGGSTTKVKKNDIINGSFLSIFMDVDRVGVAMFLMVLCFIGAMGDVFLTPLMTFLTARLMKTVGNVSSLTLDSSLINYYLLLSSFFLDAHVLFIRINLIIVYILRKMIFHHQQNTIMIETTAL